MADKQVEREDGAPLSVADAADKIFELPDEILSFDPDTPDNQPAPKKEEQASEPDEGEEPPEASETPEEETPAEPVEEEQPAEPEPGVQGFDPPADWTAEDGARFRNLPLSTQETILRYDRQTKEAITRAAEQTARERETVQADREKARAEQAAFAELRQQYEQRLKDSLGQADPPPDLALINENPMEYLRQKAAWDARQQQREQTRAELASIEEQKRKEAETAESDRIERHNQRLTRERERLAEEWPEYFGAEAQKVQQDFVSGLITEFGYTPEEVGMVADHRTIVMAREALAMRRMKKSQPNAQRKVQAKPRSLQPGTAQPKGSELSNRQAKSRELLRKTGSVDAAAAFFYDALE